MTSILALFTCHNRIEKTKACISSLMTGNDQLLWDFVVADDASTDGTREYLEGLDNVKIVNCDGNAFYSGGMRAAIALAKDIVNDKNYDYILFLNDDFDCYQNGISRMIDLECQVGKETIIVASTEEKDGKCSYSGVIKRSKFLPKYSHVLSKEIVQITNLKDINLEKLRADTFNANCVLIPTDIFLKLPNIDKAYIHSLGDYDYGMTAVRMGYRILATPFFVGYCENDHKIKGSWKDPNLKRIERIKKKEHPLGQPSKPWFHFLRKNYNIITAVVFWTNDYIKILLGK